MKNIIKNSILKAAGIIALVAFFAVSCEKKEENNLQSNKWNLKEVIIKKDSNPNDSLYFENSEIVFEFQNYNKLLITGSNNNFLFDNFTEGEHDYEYREANICETCLPGPNLAIDKPASTSDNGWYVCFFVNNNESMHISGDFSVYTDHSSIQAGNYGLFLTLNKLIE